MSERDRNQFYYNRNEGRYENRNDEGRYENRNESPYRDQFGRRDWDFRDDPWHSQSRDRSGELRDHRDYNERNYGGLRQQDDRNIGAGYTGYESRRFPATFGAYEDQRYDRDLDRNASQERYGRNWGHEGVYRGAQRERDEGFGQRLRDVGQQALRKVKRVFRGPKGYKRSDDRIREDVNDRLALQEQFDPSEIEVSVSNGEVTLIGVVEWRHEKFLAEEIADDVSGVNEVHNQLRVGRAQSSQSTATESTQSLGAGTEASRNRNARAQ